MNDGENPPHFKSHFHELFGKNTKGSQTFRKILKYDALNNPTYDTKSWCKKLKTSEICRGERNANKAIQNKYLPRQLLDFKAPIILGKTQFNHSLAQWTAENISPYCVWCMEKGDHVYANLLHTLYTCPLSQSILQYIRKKLTSLKEITPVSVILTNNRCTKQVDNKGSMHKNRNKTHTVCSIYDETFDKSTTLDFIFSLTLKYIIECQQTNIVATPKDALFTILSEMRYFIKARPSHLISAYLMKNIQILKISTDDI